MALHTCAAMVIKTVTGRLDTPPKSPPLGLDNSRTHPPQYFTNQRLIEKERPFFFLFSLYTFKLKIFVRHGEFTNHLFSETLPSHVGWNFKRSNQKECRRLSCHSSHDHARMFKSKYRGKNFKEKVTLPTKSIYLFQAGKIWVFEHCHTATHAYVLLDYILSLATTRKGQEERIHMIYLVNDILFHT